MQKVTVLMSTYNGEKYLEEQIDSILGQEHVDVELIIRDDCSSDSTREILKTYEMANRNVHLFFGEENLGVTGSFFSLICNNINSEYFALADQDDIWDSDKLVSAVHLLQRHSQDVPLLYYSNLRIVDSEGNYCRNSHEVPHIGREKYSCFTENLATGCTIVYNKKLAELAHKIQPKTYSIHDAWMYATAKMFGNVIYDFEPHIRYRQHGGNQIGTYQKMVSIKKLMKELKLVINRKEQPWWNNAQIFYKQFETQMSNEEKNMIMSLIDYKLSLKKKCDLLKNKKFESDSFSRNVRLKMKILLGTL